MRKLACFAISFSLATFLSHFLFPNQWIPVSAAVFSVGLFAVPFLLPKIRKCRFYPLLILLVFFGFGTGVLNYGIHQMQTVAKAQKLNDTEQTMLVQILEKPVSYDRYDRLHVRITEDSLPHLHAMMYDYDHSTSGLQPGDRIRVTAKLRSADIRYGEKNDAYISRDIYLTGTLRNGWEYTGHRSGIRIVASKLNGIIKEVCDSVFPESTIPFMKALLLGDKTEFYEDVSLYAAMSRAGMMHVIAVSGMHIAFLVGLIQLLLGSGRRSSFLCLVILWMFVLITGASASAVRAGIMQSILLLAPILRRENDSLTSLSFALMTILLINPYSCASVSLQLSFGAMAGLLLFAKPVSDYLLSLFPNTEKNRLLRDVCMTAGASLAVMAFSAPLAAIHFNSFSVLSPVTNIVSLFAVSICFSSGILACCAGMILLPLGQCIGWFSGLFARYLITVASLIAKIPFSAVYLTSRAAVFWMLLSYLLAAAAVIWKSKSALRILLPVILSFCCLFAVFRITQWNYRKPDGFLSVLDVGQGECVCVMSEEKTLLFDCGNTGSLTNAGETAASYLNMAGRKRVDALILSHMHEDHANGVPLLLELIPVERIYALSDADCSPDLMKEIQDAVQRHGVEWIPLSEDQAIQFGSIQTELYMPTDTGEQNERCIISKVSIGDTDALLTGDAPKSTEYSFLDDHMPQDVEMLVVGHHGSRSSTSGELLKALQGNKAIISCGLNSYGHPSYEVLERLYAYGYEIYRTDLQGTIEIRIRNKR